MFDQLFQIAPPCSSASLQHSPTYETSLFRKTQSSIILRILRKEKPRFWSFTKQNLFRKNELIKIKITEAPLKLADCPISTHLIRLHDTAKCFVNCKTWHCHRKPKFFAITREDEVYFAFYLLEILTYSVIVTSRPRNSCEAAIRDMSRFLKG